jgi:tetratricopeptide (TPR) repeat protein
MPAVDPRGGTAPVPRHTPLPRAAPPPRHTPSPRPAARRRRRLPLAGLAGAAALVAVAVGLWVALREPAPPPGPPPPDPVEVLVARWREQGLVGARAAGGGKTLAEAMVAEGRAALEADRPDRTAAAAAAFRDALAAEPGRLDAAAGWATAFAEAAGDAPDGEALQAAHDAIRFGLEREPRRADLLAAYARLLLLVPSPQNAAEAIEVAERAVAADPADAGARLALGLARIESDPAAAARELEEASASAPRDRRLLTAAARARWRAGDGLGAVALARRRIDLDDGHVASLALLAEIEIDGRRLRQARGTLARWARAEPQDARPHVELAKIAYQVEGDLAGARTRLEGASRLARGAPFVAARALAHLAAVARAAGDESAAAARVAEALDLVPASGPARFQAALLAFARGDGARLRESAGILGRRGGSVVARLLAARSAEISGTADEAIEAYRLVGDLAPRDPAVLLVAGGGVARLGASGPAIALAERALARDPLEGKLGLAVTDYWEGPGALADASRRYQDIARAEPSAAATALAAAAVCEIVLGRTQAAEGLAERASAAAPQRALPVALLAQVALDRGQARRALSLAQTAVSMDPVDPVALEVRARAIEALGRRLEAQGAHRQAIEVGPDLSTARLALARLLARDGQREAARAEIESLLRDDPGLREARGALLDLADRPGR